jgi:hypothetical protein
MNAAVLHFAPWMRRGLAGALTAPADGNGVPEAGFGVVTASVSLGAERLSCPMQLLGPGTVRGLNSAEVVRCFPAPDSVSAEDNAFPHLELARPDLPWMFTPAAAQADRLLPWLVLVVVEERQGVEFRLGDPLPVLRVDEADRELPALDQAFAWVHVQYPARLGDDIARAFATRPEDFVARLLAPRRLQAGTWYRACLVPTFRTGREAGLGRAVDSADPSVALAWETGAREIELPVYHSWRFQTARQSGDFEALVGRLKPRTLPGDVGMHPLDVGDPGSRALPQQPGTLTSYLGAFTSPRLQLPRWPEAHEQRFRRALGEMLEQGLETPARDPAQAYDPLQHDPVVAPPVYGARPAGVRTMGRGAGNPPWLLEANLDPACRVVAGLGAEVVRRNQEILMAEAWEQAAAVREANAVLNRTRLALEVGKRLHRKVEALDGGRWLQWSRGAHARLKGAGLPTTLQGIVRQALPRGVVSAAFRRRFRPGTSFSPAQPAPGPARAGSLVGTLTVAYLEERPAMLAYARCTTPPGVVKRSDDPEGSPGGPRGATSPAGLSRPAAKDRQAAVRSAIALSRKLMDPGRLLRARVRHIIRTAKPLGREAVPAALRVEPDLRHPLYEELVRLDPELLMPGVGSLPRDTVALARLNTAFVEAFLLGANDMLAAEFAWREFPADPRGTWLSCFWNAIEDAEPGPGTPARGDIPAIAGWPRASRLGSHAGHDPAQTIVLILKGDLLRRYPRTSIYAVRATWARNDAAIYERVEDTSRPPVYPSLFGTLGSDVTFVGLQFPTDVRVDEDLVGDTTAPTSQRPQARAGWFLAFEQEPSEPHFGLDVGTATHRNEVPQRWEQLSWEHVMGESGPTYVDLAILIRKAGRAPRLAFDDIGPNQALKPTWASDAAAMASITWQRPVRVLVHADQMLRPLPAEPGEKV